MNDETNLSPWQHHRSKPKSIGVYQRKIHGAIRYSYWNGDYWCAYAHDNVSLAKRYMNKTMRSSVQYAKWRGVIDEE